MTKDGIANLLETIAIHYPSFEKRIYTDGGNIRTAFIDEWYNRIGFMNHDVAMDMFTNYLRSEEKYAPTVAYFLNEKPKKDVILDTGYEPVYHVGQVGELLDEFEGEYCNPEDIDEKYIYMGDGIIMAGTGRIVQGTPLSQPRLKKCCGNCEHLRWSPLWICTENRETHEQDDSCGCWKIRKYAEKYLRGGNK